MTKRELEAKVEELERRLRDLEARPVYVPYVAPYAPLPAYPSPPWHPSDPVTGAPTITCLGGQVYPNGMSGPRVM